MDHMQIICTLLQTDNHASTSAINFLQARWSSGRPTNSIKALKVTQYINEKATIRWQDSAPPISGYWPTSEPNTG